MSQCKGVLTVFATNHCSPFLNSYIYGRGRNSESLDQASQGCGEVVENKVTVGFSFNRRVEFAPPTSTETHQKKKSKKIHINIDSH